MIWLRWEGLEPSIYWLWASRDASSLPRNNFYLDFTIEETLGLITPLENRFEPVIPRTGDPNFLWWGFEPRLPLHAGVLSITPYHYFVCFLNSKVYILATPAGLEPATNCLDYALEDSHFTGLPYPQAKAVALSFELRSRMYLAVTAHHPSFNSYA